MYHYPSKGQWISSKRFMARVTCDTSILPFCLIVDLNSSLQAEQMDQFRRRRLGTQHVSRFHAS